MDEDAGNPGFPRPSATDQTRLKMHIRVTGTGARDAYLAFHLPNLDALVDTNWLELSGSKLYTMENEYKNLRGMVRGETPNS